MALLQAENCGIQFGGLKALSHFSLQLEENKLLAVIGPNGAGKTTFFNLLTGVYPLTEGKLFFADQTLGGLKPYQISRLGVARTFQNIRLFGNLSVEDNVLAGFHHQIETSLWSAVLRRKKYQEETTRLRRAATALLELLGLSAHASELAKNLSYGNQRRLEIARALATKPKLLLLDEPAAGMNPTEKKQLIEMIKLIHQKFSLAILLIEHDMSVVMTLCPRIIVLDYGVIIAEGSPDEIRKHPRVIEAYLGVAPTGLAPVGLAPT